MPYVFSIFALPCRRNLARLLGYSPPELTQAGLHLLGRFSVPIPTPSPLLLLFPQFLLSSKTLVTVPPLSHLLAGLLNHLLSFWGCHMMPSFSSSRTSFLLCFLHVRHWAYKCSTVCSLAPHHQHSGVLITPILAKNVPTAPCLTLSWQYREVYFLEAFPSIMLIPSFVRGI